jgi:uncharacterized protein (UPF0332 family)
MGLENLINQGRLTKFRKISAAQVKGRFTAGTNFFNLAKISFDNRADDTSLGVIYSNLYDSARIFCQTLLLLKGYKTIGKNHHETTFVAAQSLFDDPALDNIFSRLKDMRNNRNTIEYGPNLIEISVQNVKQAIKDIRVLSDKLDHVIKGGQKKLV